MTDFNFLFLVNTPGMYYQGNSTPQRPSITSQARSHAAMAFHRKRHAALQVKSTKSTTGLARRAILMSKPRETTRSRRRNQEDYEDNSIITAAPPAVSRKGAVSIRDFPLKSQQQFERHLSPLSHPVDILPGVPHRDSAGFSAAAEFYSTVKPDLVHAPVFHIFDVSNTFAKSGSQDIYLYPLLWVISCPVECGRDRSYGRKEGELGRERELAQAVPYTIRGSLQARSTHMSYYDLMTHEVALHAGVAVANMVRDVFVRSNFPNNKTGPSAQVLRLIQVAISKLREHMVVQDEDPGGGGDGRHRRQRAVNDDGAIIAALFLGHIASGFGDLEAFQMHRRGIKTMIESRGGLDVLGLDGMLKCSVLQFESWWTHIYRDTSVFASSKPAYSPVYLSPPYSAETLRLLSRLPPGFRRLATRGQLAMDVVTVLSSIAAYQDAIQTSPGGVARQMEAVASLPARRRHADFSDACTCLLDPAPNFEKYLVFALICYASVAFAPDRHYLSASHTAFRTPRLLLTQDLPTFRVVVEEEEHDVALRDETSHTEEAGDNNVTEKECLVWMWLVTLSSWTATDGPHSGNAASLQSAFRARFPEYCDRGRLDLVLRQFFWTDALDHQVEMKAGLG
ncbi:uncharacterized protein Z520_02543 [Fonsecaea multimorphosa CBS 102226]|uniref:Transcription factor domain-containing protein n=1 Tax=Fonsecaea multimorphosa CBS 102226 TaxID=1442371 RepID=A0A0D2KG57_9EURO|nr:uncharacterized protein Z520_02543 [Fonsecaea multimorphosa CBS 102226]KIY02405.1 hypothetical protein Z520_02543 [Fonsecaea multimorphosa CBS 102226]